MPQKFLACLFLSIFLLIGVSCVSIDGKVLSKGERDEAREALNRLASELASEQVEVLIPLASLRAGLPSSYTFYASYDPLYGEVTERYLMALTATLSEVAKDALPYLREPLLALSNEVDTYAFSSRSMTSTLRGRVLNELESVIYGLIKEREMEFGEDFSEAEAEFNRILKVYKNLEKSGKETNLVTADPIPPNQLATILAQSILSTLETEELLLKSGSESRSPSSPYHILWRINNGR